MLQCAKNLSGPKMYTKDFSQENFCIILIPIYTQSNTPLITMNSCDKMAEERRKQTLFDKHDNNNYIIIIISTNFNFTDIFGKNQKAVMLQ